MKRVSYDQAARKSVYCTHGVHVTIVDPQHHYSGDPHGIELAECDCTAVGPSTQPGEGEHSEQSESSTEGQFRAGSEPSPGA